MDEGAASKVFSGKELRLLNSTFTISSLHNFTDQTFAMSENTADILYVISLSCACTVLYTVAGKKKASRPL